MIGARAGDPVDPQNCYFLGSYVICTVNVKERHHVLCILLSHCVYIFQCSYWSSLTHEIMMQFDETTERGGRMIAARKEQQ